MKPSLAPLDTLPRLCHHKATGQGFVRIKGRCIYLGLFDSPKTLERYHQLLAEYMATGGNYEPHLGQSLVVAELMDRFWHHAKTYYLDADGNPTSEITNLRQALRPLMELYGLTAVEKFTPLALKTVRERMIQIGWCRNNINKHVSRIKQLFRWGTENDLVDGGAYHALQAVAGLKRGRSPARETKPVGPAPQELIDAVQPWVGRQVWAVIQMQLLTGARQGEILSIKPCDIDRSGSIWVYPTDGALPA